VGGGNPDTLDPQGLPTQTEKNPLKTPDFGKKNPKNFRLKIP
jgi:hypothetical protein